MRIHRRNEKPTRQHVSLKMYSETCKKVAISNNWLQFYGIGRNVLIYT
jgi:hypothetical protein